MTALQNTQKAEAVTASKNANMQSIGLIIASVACGAVGQLILKAGMKSLGPLELSLNTLMSMATSPLLIVGIAVFGVSTLLWLLALLKADLSFAYPFLSLTYIAVLIGGAVLFQENVTLPRVVGFAVIVAGVLIVARSEQKKGYEAMRVGIIGGGLMGITLAYFLAETGEQVTVLEQGNELGGLNGELQFENGLSVARYQHAILPTDRHVLDLCRELNLSNEIVFQNVQTGFVHERQIQPMGNIRDFLTFPLLGMGDRIRLGSTILRARGKGNWRELDSISAKKWLIQVGGSKAFEQIWRPLLDAKFDGVYDDVAATYIWAWLNRMSAIRRVPNLQGSVGYLRRGHYSLIRALADRYLARGGQVEYQVRVREIDVTGGQLQRVRTQSGSMEFDVLVAAVATPNFARLIPGADEAYLNRLEKSKYLGLICPVMVLDRPLSPYWTLNLTDPSVPFSTIIETPHPTSPNDHVVYLPRYTAPDNDWMGVSDDDIREAWLHHLKPMFPNFNENQIRHFAVSRSRYVEPVYHVNMLENMPAVQTPYEGLYLANTAQVYPELATSEAAIAQARHVTNIVRQRRVTPNPAVN